MNYLQMKKQALLNYVQSGGRLPSEYQEVEWIGSSGTQYIDTQILVTTSDCKIEFKFEKTASGNNMCLCGAEITSNWSLNFNGEWWLIAKTNGFSNQKLKLTPNLNELYEWSMELNNGVFNFDIGTETRTGAYTIGDINITLCLFADNRATGANQYGRYKLYKCKYYSLGNLERDFAPCYRKADDVIGLYDLVYDTFYTNAGSGTFTKGNDV